MFSLHAFWSSMYSSTRPNFFHWCTCVSLLWDVSFSTIPIHQESLSMLILFWCTKYINKKSWKRNLSQNTIRATNFLWRVCICFSVTALGAQIFLLMYILCRLSKKPFLYNKELYHGALEENGLLLSSIWSSLCIWKQVKEQLQMIRSQSESTVKETLEGLVVL